MESSSIVLDVRIKSTTITFFEGSRRGPLFKPFLSSSSINPCCGKRWFFIQCGLQPVNLWHVSILIEGSKSIYFRNFSQCWSSLQPLFILGTSSNMYECISVSVISLMKQQFVTTQFLKLRFPHYKIGGLKLQLLPKCCVHKKITSTCIFVNT